jgi:ribosomal protein S18 acetylase RimI-like enzyme
MPTTHLNDIVAQTHRTGARAADLRLTRAQLSDADSVLLLFGALHRYNASLDAHFTLSENWTALLRCEFEETVRHPDRLWMLAQDGKRAVGLLIAALHTDLPLFAHRQWVEIEALYVDEMYRCQRVASLLLAEVYRWAEERQVYRLQLYVTASNVRAQAVYTSQGFTLTQAIMRKTLVQGRMASEPAGMEGETTEPPIGR